MTEQTIVINGKFLSQKAIGVGRYAREVLFFNYRKWNKILLTKMSMNKSYWAY